MIKRSEPVRPAYCLRAQQHLRQLSLILLTSLLLSAHTTETEGAEHGGHHIYHGTYTGRCRSDGYYYLDKGSIVLCSNGNSYRQACAPGTVNKDSSHYSGGHSYSYAEFCNVNLNDYGYGASRPSHHQHYSYYQSEPDYHRYGYHDFHQSKYQDGYGPIHPQQHYPYAYFPPIEAHHQSYGH